MLIEHGLGARVSAGTGPALLVTLARASSARAWPPDLAPAMQAVGDPTGETWLNLLGVALDAGEPWSAERLLEAFRTLEPLELRRQLLGRHAWSWCGLVGAETIEAAAAGDGAAADALLEHPRYYAGVAPQALATLLPLDADETKRRLVAAVEAGLTLLEPGADEALADAARAADEALTAHTVRDAIARVTGGYRYVPEPEAENVVLVPHLEGSPWLVLAQHRSSRLIVYAAPRRGSAEERLTALGQALGDPKRVEILRLLGRAPRTAAELLRETGLARSTLHHHLGKLREARLVELEGNARAYRYAARKQAPDELAELVADVVDPG
jgi:DNA-binding transcriptional ArsR family regulator